VLGTHRHSRLLGMMHGSSDMSRYCCEHLPSTRVVVLRPED
jgi:hypothetical protein